MNQVHKLNSRTRASLPSYTNLSLFKDQAFLDSINDNRLLHGLGQISCGAFEIVIDRLEKEWFALVRIRMNHQVIFDSDLLIYRRKTFNLTLNQHRFPTTMPVLYAL